MTTFTVEPDTLTDAASEIARQVASLTQAIQDLNGAAGALASGTAGAASESSVAEIGGEIARLQVLLERLQSIRAWVATSATVYQQAQTTVDGTW